MNCILHMYIVYRIHNFLTFGVESEIGNPKLEMPLVRLK